MIDTLYRLLEGAEAQIDCHSILDQKPEEMSWRDYVVLLLQTAAEIEHSLMVQYLYAAYSLGGAGVSERLRTRVYHWRNTILSVAKEEMGHLLTVNNVLRFLGAPMTLGRPEFPRETSPCGIPYALERLSPDSLRRYVAAEMPPGFLSDASMSDARDRDELFTEFAMMRPPGEVPNNVGALYNAIIEAITTKLEDSAFDDNTYSSQASWDEWGKEYGVDVVSLGEKPLPSKFLARVFVSRAYSRTQAIAVLKEVAEQGEAPLPSDPSGEPSHFHRFVEIYVGFTKLGDRIVTRNVPPNPTTRRDGNAAWTPGSDSNLVVWAQTTYIENDQSRAWATLFNLRYQILLTYLLHTYRVLAEPESVSGNVRPGLLHRVFCEMYNLRTIAETLVRMPLVADPDDPRRAGPPFELPSKIELPSTAEGCWQLHVDLLNQALSLVNQLLGSAAEESKIYLASLRDLDKESFRWMDRIVSAVRS